MCFFFFSFKFLGLELGVLLGMLVVYNYSPLKLPSTPRVGRLSYVYTSPSARTVTNQPETGLPDSEASYTHALFSFLSYTVRKARPFFGINC